MTTIDLFYQGEGLSEIEHIQVDPSHTFSAVKALLIKKHGMETDVLISLEDSDEPLNEILIVRDHVGPAGIKAHVHRCRQIAVSVTFNNETVKHNFGPSTTIARVKRWAAEKKFGMSAEEAGEHVLQISGTHDRPTLGTHLGSLVKCPHCQIAFDLVPDHRVNGAFIGVAR